MRVAEPARSSPRSILGKWGRLRCRQAQLGGAVLPSWGDQGSSAPPPRCWCHLEVNARGCATAEQPQWVLSAPCRGAFPPALMPGMLLGRAGPPPAPARRGCSSVGPHHRAVQGSTQPAPPVSSWCSEGGSGQGDGPGSSAVSSRDHTCHPGTYPAGGASCSTGLGDVRCFLLHSPWDRAARAQQRGSHAGGCTVPPFLTGAVAAAQPTRRHWKVLEGAQRTARPVLQECGGRGVTRHRALCRCVAVSLCWARVGPALGAQLSALRYF